MEDVDEFLQRKHREDKFEKYNRRWDKFKSGVKTAGIIFLTFAISITFIEGLLEVTDYIFGL